jgi:cell division protein FtsZ
VGIDAVSDALMHPGAGSEEVTIRPLPRSKPSLLLEQGAGQPQDHPAMPPAFIPPAPEPVANRPRMPRFEDLPMPAQNEIRARRGELPEPESSDKRRMTLLQRLASVGLGRREAEPSPSPRQPVQPVQPMQPMQPAPPVERVARAPVRAADAGVEHPASMYGKRQMQNLDIHGRQQPVHNSAEEDQLEIPAFLRRQAN